MKGMERIGHSDEGVELWGKTQGVQGWREEEEEEVVRETKEKKWQTLKIRSWLHMGGVCTCENTGKQNMENNKK